MAGFERARVRRSFWAILWCFPLMIPNWIWWHGIFVDYTAPGMVSGSLFYLRMALIELSLWFLPYLTVGLANVAARHKPPVRPHGRHDELAQRADLHRHRRRRDPRAHPAAAARLLVLCAPDAAHRHRRRAIRLFYMLAKRNWSEAAVLTAASVIPSMLASVWLNDFLGVSL